MNDTFAYVLVWAFLLLGVWTGWLTLRDHRVTNPLFYVISVLEVALLVQLVAGIVALVQTDRDVEGVVFVSYLVTVVLVPPVAVVWGISEKTRWGVGVVCIAMITEAALVLRLLDIWTGRHV